MAEEALRTLEEQLQCAICLDTYTDPKLLQCFHVFCRDCLLKLVVQYQQGQLILTCPTCRQITPIPVNGVAGLQPAFHINELFDIIKKAKTTPATVEERVPCPAPLKKKTTLSCSEHDGRELELHCETCEKLICSHCVFRGQKHHSHEYDLISSSFEKYKEKMTSSLEPMEKKLEAVNQSLEQLDAECGKISDQRAVIEARILKTITRLQEALDVRKTELIGQLHQLTQSKLKRLATQKDQIETIQAQLSSCLDFVKESLKTESHGEVLKMKTTIEKKVEELTSISQPNTLKPITEADITFSNSPDIKPVAYGQVFSQGSPDPLKYNITGKGLEVAEAGKKSTLNLQVFNYKGELCEEALESLECELVSELGDATVRGHWRGKGHGKYKISYRPTIKGLHQLHVKVNNQPIRGSPFVVRVKYTPAPTIGGLKSPWGVAVVKQGCRERVVITEKEGHCVAVFSYKGEKLQSFGTCGSAHGQFVAPRGVAVDGRGNILVVDSENHRIQKFTPTGRFLAAVGTRGSGHLQFSYPQDIAFNPTNSKVYVVDNDNHRVQILNSDLTFFAFSSTFGRRGYDNGEFAFPCGIACDSTGKVYVADTWNDRIQVFTAKGEFLKVFGKKGQGRGELYSPTGVAVDKSDMVYVSESDNHRVSVFNSEGQFMTSFGREGSEPGKFRSPYGLTVDGSGVVYICDSGNNVVQSYPYVF